MAKKPNKVQSTLAPEEEGAREWRRHRLLVRLGQTLMVIGAIVGIAHWLTHLEAIGAEQPPGWLDLVAGYPMAVVLLVVGAVIAGRKAPTAASKGAR